MSAWTGFPTFSFNDASAASSGVFALITKHDLRFVMNGCSKIQKIPLD